MLPYMVHGARPLRPGQPFLEAVPLYMRHTVFTSCGGLHFGQLRGISQGGETAWWRPEVGVPKPVLNLANSYGWFVPVRGPGCTMAGQPRPIGRSFAIRWPLWPAHGLRPAGSLSAAHSRTHGGTLTAY